MLWWFLVFPCVFSYYGYRGVYYSSIPIGQTSMWSYNWASGLASLSGSLEPEHTRDWPIIQALGVNLVRMSGVGYHEWDKSGKILDDLNNVGIKVMMSFSFVPFLDGEIGQPWYDSVLSGFKEFWDYCDHPAVTYICLDDITDNFTSSEAIETHVKINLKDIINWVNSQNTSRKLVVPVTVSDFQRNERLNSLQDLGFYAWLYNLRNIPLNIFNSTISNYTQYDKNKKVFFSISASAYGPHGVNATQQEEDMQKQFELIEKNFKQDDYPEVLGIFIEELIDQWWRDATIPGCPVHGFAQSTCQFGSRPEYVEYAGLAFQTDTFYGQRCIVLRDVFYFVSERFTGTRSAIKQRHCTTYQHMIFGSLFLWIGYVSFIVLALLVVLCCGIRRLQQSSVRTDRRVYGDEEPVEEYSKTLLKKNDKSMEENKQSVSESKILVDGNKISVNESKISTDENKQPIDETKKPKVEKTLSTVREEKNEEAFEWNLDEIVQEYGETASIALSLVSRVVGNTPEAKKQQQHDNLLCLKHCTSQTAMNIMTLIEDEATAMHNIASEPEEPQSVREERAPLRRKQLQNAENKKSQEDKDDNDVEIERKVRVRYNDPKAYFQPAVATLHASRFAPYKLWCKSRGLTRTQQFLNPKNKTLELFMLHLIRDMCESNSQADSIVCWNMHRFLQRLHNYQQQQQQPQPPPQHDRKGKDESVGNIDKKIDSVPLYFAELHYGLAQINGESESGERINYEDIDMCAHIDAPLSDHLDDVKLPPVKRYVRESPGVLMWIDFWRDYDFFFWLQFAIFTTGTACSFLIYQPQYEPFSFLVSCAYWESRVWCVIEFVLLFHYFWQSRCLGGLREYALVFRIWAFVISWLWGLFIAFYQFRTDFSFPIPSFYADIDSNFDMIILCGQFGVRVILWRLLPTLLVGCAHRFKLQCCRSSVKPLSAPSIQNDKLPSCCVLKPRNHLFWGILLILQFASVTLIISNIYTPFRVFQICEQQCEFLDKHNIYNTSLFTSNMSPTCGACTIGVVSSWSIGFMFSCALFSMLFYVLVAFTAKIQGLRKGFQKHKAIKILDVQSIIMLWRTLRFVFGKKALFVWKESVRDMRNRDKISNFEFFELSSAFDFAEREARLGDINSHLSQPPPPPREISLPQLPEARVQFSNFIWSLRHLESKFPSFSLQMASQTQRYGVLSLLIPIHRDPVSAPMQKSHLALMRDHSQEFQNWLERRDFVEAEVLTDLENTEDEDPTSPTVEGARIWGSRRLETVERAVLGALQTYTAFKVLGGARVEIIIGAAAFADYPTVDACGPDIELFLSNRIQLQSLIVRAGTEAPNSIFVVFPWKVMDKKLIHEDCRFCYNQDLAAVKLVLNEDGNGLENPRGFYTVIASFRQNEFNILRILPCQFDMNLGKGHHSTQGIAGILTQMLRLVSGHFIQIYDANMDCTFMESVKLPFVLNSFFPNPDNPSLPDDANIRALRRYSSISFPKNIFTINHGFVGRAMAVPDLVFTSHTQRILHMLDVQPYMGHPDIVDSTQLFRGNLCKASPNINSSAYTLKGVDLKIRQCKTKFVDYLVGFKGRESTLVACSVHLVRISAGASASIRSRDMSAFNVIQGRDCSRGFDCGITRTLALFQSGPGWFFYHVLISWTIQLYIFSLLMFQLGTVSFNDVHIDSSIDLLTNSWLLDVIMVLMIPLICKYIEDRGVASAIIPSIKDTFIAGIFFIFQNQTIAYAFVRTSITGEAVYQAPSRRSYLDPHTKSEALKQYLHSHYMVAFHIFWQYAVYLLLVEAFIVKPLLLVLCTAGVWISVPVLFVHDAKACDWVWYKKDISEAWHYALDGDLSDDLKKWARIQHPNLMTALMSFGVSLFIFALALFTFSAVTVTQCIYCLVFIMPLHIVWTGLCRVLSETRWPELLAGMWLLFGFLAAPLVSFCSPYWCLDLSWTLGAVMLICVGNVCYRLSIIILFLWHACRCDEVNPFPTDDKRTKCGCKFKAETFYFVFLTFYIEAFVAMSVLLYQTFLQFIWFVVCVIVKGVLARFKAENRRVAPDYQRLGARRDTSITVLTRNFLY